MNIARLDDLLCFQKDLLQEQKFYNELMVKIDKQINALQVSY